MIASYRAEIIKSRKRWANWILFGVLLLLLLAFGYVLTYIILTHPPRNFESRIPAKVLKRELFPENLIPHVLSGTSSLAAAIMIIFGALSTASEYGWLTVQTILMQKPSRVQVLIGKLINLAILTFLISVVILGIAALTSYALVTIDGSPAVWPSITVIAKGFGALWLLLALWAAFGMFLGVWLRSTAGAIGGGLTYLFVGEALLGQLLQNTEGVKEVLKFLPGLNGDAITASFPLTIPSPAAGAPLVSAQRGLITVAVYLVLFCVLALIIFRRRDVSGS